MVWRLEFAVWCGEKERNWWLLKPFGNEELKGLVSEEDNNNNMLSLFNTNTISGLGGTFSSACLVEIKKKYNVFFFFK